jgi:hypothetical protein
MRKIAVLSASAAAVAVGLFTAAPARADLVCVTQAGSTASACASVDDSHAAVTGASAGLPVGGATGAYASSGGSAAVLAQGNTTNPPPANGWVLASGSSDGADVSCSTGGTPAPGSGCP